MAKDPYRYFRIEARELLDQLVKGVLDLEKGSTAAGLTQRLLRLAHTLKGAARVVKQAQIADLIHGVEDTLAPYRDDGQAVPRTSVDTLLAALDAINAHLAQLPAAQDDAAVQGTAVSDAQAPQAPPRLGLADVMEVDLLRDGLSEIAGELAGVRSRMASVARARDLAGQWLMDAPGGHNSAYRARADAVYRLLVPLERSLATSVERMERELRQAQDAAQRLRLVPVATVFNALERTARDAAHSLGKSIVFEASGGEVRFDGQVLDTVLPALVQMVRNAVVHGIETPAQRQAGGKSPSGRVALEVVRRGYRAGFRCIDDGCGVDLEAVRSAMLRKGMAAAHTQGFSAQESLAFLLKGGLTTAHAVTELAGRGIGLDVVREVAQRLHGDVAVETASGTGTQIELRVPLTLASLNVLLVEVDGTLVAMALDAVRWTLRIAATDIVQTADGAAIAHGGKLIPFASLVLGGAARAVRSAAVTAVVVRAGAQVVAVGVTRLCGVDTVVLRPPPTLAPVDPLVLGLYLDAQGIARVVLDPERFAALARQAPAAQAQAGAVPPILIVDDSLTTRMLEGSILESAGFRVELACSGEEGLEMAQRRPYALFLVDVEMPGMDGFEFVKRTRADPVLRQVPCILVTSRDSAQDRRRGLDAGASAYIVKGEFDQVDFLRRVAELVAQ